MTHTTAPSRSLLVALACAMHLGGSTSVLMGQAVRSEQKLRELEGLPTGLTVELVPNPVTARLGGRSGYRYTWLYRATVTAGASDTVSITEFGSFFWARDRWVFDAGPGTPFRPQDFAEWFGCPGARVVGGAPCSDSLTSHGADSLRASRARWYYIGTNRRGERVKGEAILDQLAVADTTGLRRVFRFMAVGGSDTVFLGEPYRPLGDAEREADGYTYKLRPGSYVGAERIRITVDRRGRVTAAEFMYPAGTALDTLRARYEASLGAPVAVDSSASRHFRYVLWNDGATTFRLSEWTYPDRLYVLSRIQDLLRGSR